jgi:hypothetical protein
MLMAAPAVMAQGLKAGFARADITPAAGAEIPGGFNKNISQGVHDPLFVETAFFSNSETEVAVAGVDLVMIPGDVVAEARAIAREKYGIPDANILIAASHTHNGGPIVDCFGSERDSAYCKLVAERIADSIARAKAAAVECRLRTGVGQEGPVGFNRRFKMKDGSVKTHPGKMNPDIVEPAGPIDPDVAVIGVEDASGKMIGCIVNHALHGTTMGGNLFSADWPGYMRRTIRGGFGDDAIGVVFLNGACGDVTQVDNRSPRASEFGEAWSRRVGITVGAEALKVLARAEVVQNPRLAVTAQVVPLPIRDLAASEEELVKRETPAFGLGAKGNDIYLNEARLVRELKAKSPTFPAEVQAIRIGNVCIASNPTEFFCALGLAVKKQSEAEITMVAELANGYAGYSPTSDAFSGGGYETRTARSSFIAPGAGEMIVEAAVAAIKKVAGSQ